MLCFVYSLKPKQYGMNYITTLLVDISKSKFVIILRLLIFCLHRLHAYVSGHLTSSCFDDV